MRYRTLKELIPEGWEVKSFDSHDFMVLRYDGYGNELEEPIVQTFYHPRLTIQNKSIVTCVHYKDYAVVGYDYLEHTIDLHGVEVNRVINYLRRSNQSTTGGKP